MSADRGGIYFFYFSFSPFLGIKNSGCLVRSGTLSFNVSFFLLKHLCVSGMEGLVSFMDFDDFESICPYKDFFFVYFSQRKNCGGGVNKGYFPW